jgi:trk system potassium uptake protein TrkH
MRFQVIFRNVSILLFLLSLSFLLPAVYSFYVKDGLFFDFLYPIVFTFSLFLLGIQFKNEEPSIREAILVVVAVWFLFPLLSTFFYVKTGAIPNFIDAYFESVSGFTTTGASILTDVESLPKSVLLWRSTTHWVGGVGFVVFSLSLLPVFGAGGAQLMRFESSKVVEEKIVPRVKEMARVILVVYVSLTFTEIFLLRLAGVSLFDAVNHAFATIATGGFSNRNDSVGAFHSVLVELIIIVFMIAGATNLMTYYIAYRRRSLRAIFSYYESKSFLSILAFSILFSALVLYFSKSYENFWEDLRYAMFAVVSASTTTGFATADYTKWPFAVQALLMLLEVIGGASGSTAGGLKQFRLVTMAKTAYWELRKTLHPRLVYKVIVGNKVIDYVLMNNIWAFISIYFSTMIFFGFLLSLSGNDILTSFSASIACITGSGPGLEKVGPCGNYAFLSGFDKLLLSIEMVLGRLEVLTALTLLLPSFWKFD